MTSRFKFSRIAVIALGTALSMAVGLALAAEDTLTADQIVNALQAKPMTRGLSLDKASDPAAQTREQGFVDSLAQQANALALTRRTRADRGTLGDQAEDRFRYSV
jgi:hypothetical protein